MVYRYGASLVAKKKIGIDTTGDGKIDSWGIDTTGDGNLDTIVKGVDTTGDGKIDSMAFDTNGDGNADTVVNVDDDGGLEIINANDDVTSTEAGVAGGGVAGGGDPATAKPPVQKGTFEPQENHTHFIMVEGFDGNGAKSFRERLEMHISSNDVSGDEIQTPKMLLVISGR